MVEHQSGTLSNLEEAVEDATPKTTVDELAAQANLPVNEELVFADAILGDEKVGEPLEDGETREEVEGDVLEAEPEELVSRGVDEVDWFEELVEDEIFNSDKGPAPRLHGLRRLAKPFIHSEQSIVNALIIVPREHVQVLETESGAGDVMSRSQHVGTFNFPMASVTFNITLLDGRTFSDSADAFYSNCEALGLFPTAVASARAEARCLRKVLGIKQHAAEEIVDKDASEELAPDDDNPVTNAQSKLIDKILGQLSLPLKDLLEGITTREIFTVEELTVGEARKALRLLNDRKKQAKRKGAKKS